MSEITKRLVSAKKAFYKMAILKEAQKNKALKKFARLIESQKKYLLSENKKDMKASDPESPLHQRLKLDELKLKTLVDGIHDVIRLPDPTGQVLSRMKLDRGLILEKKTVPLGVLGIIFESRPDVIPQILSLVIKSGNACVLKGGREATHSNRAFMTLAHELSRDLTPNWAQLLESREDVHEMLKQDQLLDLIIPRGGNELVQMVMNASKIPVLGHADGVCHLYVHSKADLKMAVKLALDGKCQYPAACNSIETLLVDTKIAVKFLKMFEPEAEINKIKIAKTSDWRKEYGNLTLAIRVVKNLEQAIQHINTYGSHHTDLIVTKDSKAAETFLNEVDSASVMVNASTRFADGFRYGLGAEVGISTSKLHARGPVGLEGLVIYKWQLKGQGQIASDYLGKSARKFLHENMK